MIEELGRQIKAASLQLASLWFSSTLSLVTSRYVGAVSPLSPGSTSNRRPSSSMIPAGAISRLLGSAFGDR